MALIDPDGMFGGDRMARLSDQGKMHWPWFWCASNTVGRIELDYHKVVARAYRQFKEKPTEEAFWGLVREFRESYLLFVYEYEGQLWGAWDTSEKFLPRHKLSADLRSPAPTAREFTDFRNSYIEDKKTRASRKLNIISDFGNFAETRASSRADVRGVGVGVGVGEVKPICASGEAQVDSLPDPAEIPTNPTRPARKRATLTPQQEIWFTQWWPNYWLSRSRKDARDAFARHVTTEERFMQVVKATAAQRPEMLRRLPEKRPYGATWLNGERWEDTLLDAPPPGVRPTQYFDSKALTDPLPPGRLF